MQLVSNSYQYTLRPGDSLNLIIQRLYGIPSAGKEFQAAKQFLLSLNPQISNPDRITAGHIIRVDEYPPPQAIRSQTAQMQFALANPKVSPASWLMSEANSSKMCRGAPLPQWQSGPQLKSSPQHAGPIRALETTPQDQEALWALAWLEHNANLVTLPGGTLAGSLRHLNNATNTQLITDISDLYAEFKSGKITKGAYDGRRAKKIRLLQQRIGPMEKLLFGQNTAPQALRIARGGGMPATAHLTRHADKMKRVANLSSKGGVLLMGVGVAASCAQIAHTEDIKEKNEIFVETLSSTGASAGLSFLVGAFLVSNPVGWGTAIVLAVGATAAGFTAGKITKGIYSSRYGHIDIVGATGVDKVCS